jgi:hypothetical protein
MKNIDFKKQEVDFYNKCDFDCNLTKWNIKDEGRKNFYFPNFILRKNQEVKNIVGNYTDLKMFCFGKMKNMFGQKQEILYF